MNKIHPTAVIYPNVTIIGDGNEIGANCIIGAPAEHRDYWGKPQKSVIIGSNNIITGLVTIDAGTEQDTVIGNNCFIMKGAHIGHDAVIGDNVTISCGAKVGGHAIIHNHSNLGLNCVIHQKQTIQEGCMIGMGAVVTKKLKTEPYKTYAGNPARYISENDKHPNYSEYTINMKEFV
jgi:UDP-N-acetylglucosamine acyltransferase